MIQQTLNFRTIYSANRLDSGYHLSPGVQAMRAIEKLTGRGVEIAPLGDLAHIWSPKRFKRVYATAREEAVPYLRPYDVFDYMPVPADLLSVKRNEALDDLRLTTDTILVTCSGRNLGPAVLVDSYLGSFVLSHDAIRVKVSDDDLRYYLLAYINSSAGQELIRRDMSGSVIDHITVKDATGLPVPILEPAVSGAISALMRTAVSIREHSRLELRRLNDLVSAQLPEISSGRPAEGWTVRRSSVGGRLDVAPYSPRAAQCRDALKDLGGVRVQEVASIHKPASRYKAYHVGPEFGRPFLAGGQLRQETVVGPKYMADRVFGDPEWYRLHGGDTVFAADGRAYEGLGVPVMVTPDRDGWLASEHVMRLRPLPGVDSGWLYLALANSLVQEQIQVLPSGSVVDTLASRDLADVVLVPSSLGDGMTAEAAWRGFSMSTSLAAKAVELMNLALTGTSPDDLRLESWLRHLAGAKEWQPSDTHVPLSRGAGVAKDLQLMRDGTSAPLPRRD